RLQAEVRHPDEIRVREGEGHADAPAVRLRDRADLAREQFAPAEARIAAAASRSQRTGGLGMNRHVRVEVVRAPVISRRRWRARWLYQLYLRAPARGPDHLDSRRPCGVRSVPLAGRTEGQGEEDHDGRRHDG